MFVSAGARVYVNAVQHDPVVPPRIGSAAEALIRENTVGYQNGYQRLSDNQFESHQTRITAGQSVDRTGLEPVTSRV